MHASMKEGRLKQVATVASLQIKLLDDLSVMSPGLHSATLSSFLSNLYSSPYLTYCCTINILIFSKILQ
jgi:hypothetical protein